MGLYYIFLIGTVAAGFALTVFAGEGGSNSRLIVGLAILGLGAFAYTMVLLVFTILPGTDGGNRYGPDPKGPNVDVF